jgi:MFS family permease
VFKINLRAIPFIPKKTIPWIIWSIPGLFYFYDVILRIFPSTIQTQFMQVYKIDATQFGLYTACYYITYTVMQIPAGIIVDRISIYKTLFIACCCCLFGLLLTHYCHNIQTAFIGRMIIGFGAAFAYVTTLKVASVWLSASNFGIAATIADSLGMLGGIFTDKVLTSVNQIDGYQSSEYWLFLTGFLIVMLILFVLRDRPRTRRKAASKHKPCSHNLYDKVSFMQRIFRILKNKQIWLIGIVGCLYYLPSSVIGDVWGIPFLKAAYAFSEGQADNAISLFFAGWVIFGPIVGWLSDHYQLRIKPISISIALIFFMFMVLIYGPTVGFTLGIYSIYSLFFLIGILTSAHPLIFAIAKENFSLRSTGAVIAVTNTMVMLGGFLFQPLLGYLLDLANHTTQSSAVHIYTAHDYIIAMTIMPVALVIAWFTMFFVKDTGKEIEKHELERNVDSDDLDPAAKLA